MAFGLPDGIPGVGVDLVDVARLAGALERGGQPLRDRIFTPAEQQECARRHRPVEHLAARLAAKEAAMKVLGTGWTGGIAFTDFEVVSDGRQAPSLRVVGRAAEIALEAGVVEFRLSISHTDSMAVAFVIGIRGA